MVRVLLVVTALAVLAVPALAQPVQAVEIEGIGRVNSPLPVVQAQGGNLVVLVGDQPVGLGFVQQPEGTCAYDNALVMVQMGKATSIEPLAEGYYGSTARNEESLFGCLDTRDGYVAVAVASAAAVPALAGLLAEVRRVAHATHGAPITNQHDPMVLPRTQQQVSATTGAGMWKVMPGERFKVEGGDVLATMFPLGFGHTMFNIGVSEGACTPGTTAVPADVAARLFPAVLGRVWVDDQPYKLNWRAWACVEHGGATATISVLGPLAGETPPEALESSSIAAMVAAVVRSYGVEITRDPGGSGGGGGGGGEGGRRGSRPRPVVAVGAVYAGLLSLAPADGEARLGGLVGTAIRFANARGFGYAFAIDIDLGYGGGEWVGQIRTGAGFSVGRRTVIDVLVGGNVGSMGPAAAIDVHAEAGLSLPLRRGALWVGGRHAIGVAGPDHTQGELRLVMPKRDDSGWFLGARYLRFGDSVADDTITMVDHGSAYLVTFGGGFVGRN